AAFVQIQALQQQIDARVKQSGASAALSAYSKQLDALTGPPLSPFAFFFGYRGPPNLVSVGLTLQVLMDRMQAADLAPTAADVAALNKTNDELKSLLARWTKLKNQAPLSSGI
ncbi:MAG: hypothetical protein KGJ20_03420, partial [Gammaproteobacteria bacterium]|nr:hypothetical protein [Gammaproteobacteria bacterium]